MDDILDALTSLLQAAPDWIAALLALVGAASAVAALTPTPRDDHVLARLRRLLDLLALNVGGARPKDRAKR